MQKQPPDPARVHYAAAVKASLVLNEAGYEAYLIGGAVRDILLGNLPKDFDLVTNAKPEQVAELSELQPARFQDAAVAFGVSRVLVEVTFNRQIYRSAIEIATYRRDIEAYLGRKATKIEFSHLEDDVLRRDFSVNALAFDPLNDYLLDYVNGLSDLDQQLIKFIGEPKDRIKEDPLRILRAIRLKNQLGFNYDIKTREALKQAISQGWLAKIAIDRMRGEITRLIIHPSRRLALVDLDTLGALKKILPEVTACKGIKQPPQFHSEGDVFEHTMLAMEALEVPVSALLAWATLLHDIGKPLTQKMPLAAGLRIRFDKHYVVGAELAKHVLKRLNFSKKNSGAIAWMVHNHLSIDDLPKMRPGHRYNMMSHQAFADLMKLHRADANATLNRHSSGTIDAAHKTFPEIEHLWEQFQFESHTQPLNLKAEFGIDGHWLKEHFKLEDGAALGKILNRLNEAYVNGEIKSVGNAKSKVKSLLKQ